jgi:hypothetical protein
MIYFIYKSKLVKKLFQIQIACSLYYMISSFSPTYNQNVSYCFFCYSNECNSLMVCSLFDVLCPQLASVTVNSWLKTLWRNHKYWYSLRLLKFRCVSLEIYRVCTQIINNSYISFLSTFFSKKRGFLLTGFGNKVENWLVALRST